MIFSVFGIPVNPHESSGIRYPQIKIFVVLSIDYMRIFQNANLYGYPE